MAKLKSVATANLARTAVEVYTVADDTPYIKLNELIISNHSVEQVTCKVSIFKKDIENTIVIIPQLQLLSNESQFIPMSTNLNTSDKLIIEPNVSQVIDVMVSCVEM